MTDILSQEDIKFFKSCAIAINSVDSQKEKTLWATGAHAYSLYLLEKAGYDTTRLEADASHLAYLKCNDKISADNDCILLFQHYQTIISGLNNPKVSSYMKKLIEKYSTLQ